MSTPKKVVAIVVIIDASIKYKMKNGNIFLRFTLFSLFFSFFVLIKARTNVIGIIARVLVSFTIVALFNTSAAPVIPSHAEAVAVTDDVSLTAVPAKSAKPSLLKPKIEPKVGNIRAAITLNKNITDIAWATSSSSAPITGAVAAMAEPPHIEEPTPTNVEIFDGTFSALCSRKAITREVVIVESIIGSD